MRVSVSPASATCNKHPLIGFSEVVQQFAGLIIVNGSAEGDPDFQIFTVMAASFAAFTVAASLCTECMIEPELQQCVFVRVCDEVDAAAISTVAAAWAAPWHELLSPEGDGTMSAITGF